MADVDPRLTREQLLRLIDEVYAVISYEDIYAMAYSMDLLCEEVEAMLQSASKEWEQIKDRVVSRSVNG